MVTITTPPSGTFGSFKPEAPKKSRLFYVIAIFVIAILAAGYYFIFYSGVAFFEVPVFTPAPPLTPLEQKVSRLPILSFDIFDTPFYKSLKIYGVSKVVADNLGRANPFIPY